MYHYGWEEHCCIWIKKWQIRRKRSQRNLRLITLWCFFPAVQQIECDMYAWNMGNSSGKWSSFSTPWTGAIIILWAPVPSCRDSLRFHCVPFLHSYFWGIIKWWTFLHDHHQAKSLHQQSLFDHNDTNGTQTIAGMNCVDIWMTCSLIHYIPIGQSQTRICPTWSSNISYISFAKSCIVLDS